jgi:ATP-binding cassette subfamily B (MDR/TAP) protein 1
MLYGRTLIRIARKMHVEYNKSTLIAEQEISSIRTVYSFVGEEKAIAKFSSSLAGTVKLGLKQGLEKGLSIGGNRSVIFVLWAFMSWYGSRLAINHAASGGRIVSGAYCSIMGGL